jgi:hypothetical protein
VREATHSSGRLFSQALLLLALVLGGPLARASGPRPFNTWDTNAPTADLQLTNAPFKRVAAGVFELGKVTLDKPRRTVSFSATVNLTAGLLEYALVTPFGKLHESLLTTEADPLHIHLAMLLMGATGGTNRLATGGTELIEITGDRVNLWVNWKTGNRDRRVALEDWVVNLEARAPVARGPWTYNGSRVVEGRYLAHLDGSIIALITDPDALINNPRPGRDNDEIWCVNTNAVPRAGTRVQIVIELPASPEPGTR